MFSLLHWEAIVRKQFRFLQKRSRSVQNEEIARQVFETDRDIDAKGKRN